MADSDSFVQEVSEEVRRDAMFAAWKKYGPFVIGAIALVVIGTAANAWWSNRQIDAARERGGAFMEAQSVTDPAKAAESFLSLAESGEGDYAALAGLRAAASIGATGDVERAVAEYERVAALPEVDVRLTELAQLRSLMIRADIMEPKEMLTGLQPLTIPGAPWRTLALEFEAAAHLRADDREAAIKSLQSVLDTDRVARPTRERVSEMIAALGGTVVEPTDTGEGYELVPGGGSAPETTESEGQ